MRSYLIGFLAVSALASPAFAVQIVLTPANVVASSGSYTGAGLAGQFGAANIFDQQTGSVSEPSQSGYWINPDNGPATAYLTIDLGKAYNLTSFTLFNTHNAQYNDRGTGNFSIVGSNILSGGLLVGSTLVSGTLAPATHTVDPIVGQYFASATGAYRYLQFLPTSVATSPDGSHASPCCGANVYGLNELRISGSAVPEPASWALMVGGFGMLGGVLRSRRTRVAFTN